jgi:hypothetical protein
LAPPRQASVYDYIKIGQRDWSNCVGRQMQTLFLDDIDGDEARIS